eukprot:SAG11_NODE_3314_length_2528_cov_11.035817_1_plen_139_part_01
MQPAGTTKCLQMFTDLQTTWCLQIYKRPVTRPLVPYLVHDVDADDDGARGGLGGDAPGAGWFDIDDDFLGAYALRKRRGAPRRDNVRSARAAACLARLPRADGRRARADARRKPDGDQHDRARHAHDGRRHAGRTDGCR